MADSSLAQNVGLEFIMEDFAFSLRYLVGIVVVIGSLAVFQSCQLNASWVGIDQQHIAERGPNMFWIALGKKVIGINVDTGLQTDAYTFDLGTGGSLASAAPIPQDQDGNLFIPITNYDMLSIGNAVVRLDADGNRTKVIPVLNNPGHCYILDGYLFTQSVFQYNGLNAISITNLSTYETVDKKDFSPPSSTLTECDGKYWFGCGGYSGDTPYFAIWDPSSNTWTKEIDKRTSMGLDVFTLFGTAADCQLAAEYYNHVLYRISCSTGSVVKKVSLDEEWGTTAGETYHDGDVSLSPLCEWGESDAAFVQDTHDSKSWVYVFDPTDLTLKERFTLPVTKSYPLSLLGTRGHLAFFAWHEVILYVYDMDNKEVILTVDATE
jgi:hypothetical protein